MELATNEKDIHHILAGLKATDNDVGQLEKTLAKVHREGDIGPLRAWSHRRGFSYAQAGVDVQEVVKEILALSKLVEDMPSPRFHNGELVAALITSAVQGYMRASENLERKSHDHALERSEGSELTYRPTSIEHLEDKVAELTALHSIISAANSSIKLSEVLHQTAQAVVSVTQADVCSVFLYEPERDQLVLAATSDDNTEDVGHARLQLGEGITGRAARLGTPIAVRNAQSDPRFAHITAAHVDTATSILAVPIIIFIEERLMGVITIRTFKEREFSLDEIKFLETVAGEIAIAIDNARLYEQTDARLRQKVAELTTLQGVSAHIASTLNMSEVLALVAHQAAHLVHADAATIYALNPNSGTLELVAQYDLRHPHHSIFEGKLGPRVALDVETSAIGQAVLRGIPIPLPPDTDAALGLAIASEDYKSMFCVPLVAPRGIMGGICLYDLDERTFSDEQVTLLDAFAHEAAIALENSRLYEAAIQGLQIKSKMLQEMNHRVRNNLQTVASLLDMQLRRLPPDSEASSALKESMSRIQSIAAVHDLLIRSDIVSTSVFDLAHEVSEAVVSTLCTPDFKLRLIIEPVEAETIRVRSHEATLLAVLLNELVSNAILHGFAGLQRGELRIQAWLDKEDESARSVQRRTQQTVNITVANSGVVLPAGFDPQRNANLGLSLIGLLIGTDLRGEFEIKNRAKGGGVIAHIRFVQNVGEDIS